MRKLVGLLARHERKAGERRKGGRSQLDRSSRGQDQSREACSRQVFCRQGLRFWQSPDRRDRLHPCQRRARRRSPHDRHRGVWVQVVRGCSSPREGCRARRAWRRNAWKGQRDKEKANRVAQQVRRAAALTAELAAPSDKVSEVCDHPPGLRDEPVELDNVQPPVTNSPFYHSNSVAMNSFLPAHEGFFNFVGVVSGARPRTATRAQEAAAVLDETLSLFGKATGKDEASLRQLTRELWKTRAEEKQRFQDKKENACKFFRKQPSFTPKTRDEFEQDFAQKVVSGLYNSRVKKQEKYLQEWAEELQGNVQAETRRMEAREREDGARGLPLPKTLGMGQRMGATRVFPINPGDSRLHSHDRLDVKFPH